MNTYCFVIQPFDKGEFDNRYRDVLAPTIKSLGVEPYRVDEDPSANILIDTIEEKIKNSRFCLADISVDNPNVWYEVGYAFALGRSVILISKQRSSYPFDIRHRKIISYTTDSPSDFEDLKKKITERGNAILKQPMKIDSPVILNAEISGLDYQERSLLGAILKNQDSPQSSVSAWSIKEEMRRSGLNEIAFNLSVRKLLKKEMIKCETAYHPHAEEEYHTYYITENGDTWILDNPEKFDTSVSEVVVSETVCDF